MKITFVDEVQIVADERAYGVALRSTLEDATIDVIRAGTVMVAKFNDKVSYMFELGFNIKVEGLKGVSPMYPMQGSRLPMSSLPDGITETMIKAKTILFRDCRLPTALEYDRYLNAITI